MSTRVTPERIAEIRAAYAQVNLRCHPIAASNARGRCVDAIPELLSEVERLTKEVSDSDILFGRGWQESLKAVGGKPHEAAHMQMTRLAGDVAILEDEAAQLRAEVERLQAENDELRERT